MVFANKLCNIRKFENLFSGKGIIVVKLRRFIEEEIMNRNIEPLHEFKT